ncbi:MAG: hypothetical protein RMJ45_07250, partial [Candidatus Calescibacterium sp.]|nr:hypothetical protein [Candidatus Calescibacterium sp.]
IREGVKKGLKEALVSVIQVKFGKISKSIKKEIMEIDDVDKLRFLKREIMKAKTLKEFEKKLRTIKHSR